MGAAPLDVRFYSGADEVNDFLADCGEEGRNAYRNMQLADLLYPAVFGVFLASALALTLRRSSLNGRTPSCWPPSPWPVAHLDYLENAFAWIALTTYPDPTISNSLLGFASAAKTSVFWAAGLGLIVGAAALALRAVRRRAAGPARQLG